MNAMVEYGANVLGVMQTEALARDLVLYGNADLQGVLDSHDLTAEGLELLLDTNPLLETEIRRLRKQVEADPKAATRIAAQEVVSLAIPELSSIIQSQLVEPRDRIKAVELSARLADVLPKEAKSAGSGVAVQINFGPKVSEPTVKPINPPT